MTNNSQEWNPEDDLGLAKGQWGPAQLPLLAPLLRGKPY